MSLWCHCDAAQYLSADWGTSFFHLATRLLATSPAASCFLKEFTVLPTPVSCENKNTQETVNAPPLIAHSFSSATWLCSDDVFRFCWTWTHHQYVHSHGKFSQSFEGLQELQNKRKTKVISFLFVCMVHSLNYLCYLIYSYYWCLCLYNNQLLSYGTDIIIMQTIKCYYRCWPGLNHCFNPSAWFTRKYSQM